MTPETAISWRPGRADRRAPSVRFTLSALLVVLLALAFASTSRAQAPADPVTDAELDRPLREPPSSPSEQTRKRAGELYNQGLDLAKQRKRREALRAFRKSYEQHSTADTIANIAALELLIGKPRAAAEHLTKALDRLAIVGSISSEVRADLRKRLDEAKKAIGTVDLAIYLPGADVQWNAVWLGSAPMHQQVYVEPSVKQMLIARYGGVELRREVTLAKGETLRIELTAADFPGAAQPARGAAADATAASPDPSPSQTPNLGPEARADRLPWILGGVGLSLAFAGTAIGGFGAMAVADGERSRIGGDVVKLGGTCSPKPLVGFEDDCRARDQEASNQTIGMGVGIAGAALALTAGAITLGLVLKSPSAQVAVMPGPGGVWVRGKF